MSEKIHKAYSWVWNNPKIIFPAFILLWGVWYIFFGRIITANDGLGFDGRRYAAMAKDFYDYAFISKNIVFYYSARVLPSLVINIILTVFNIEKDNFAIIKSFQILNLVLLTFTAYLWVKIAEIYKLSNKFTWVGFFFGFINYGIIKYTFYYPVLTDTTAFFLGFMLLYFYIVDSFAGKVIIILLGSFVWTTFTLFGLLLLIFPINKPGDDKLEFDTKNLFLSLLLPVFFLVNGALLTYTYMNGGIRLYKEYDYDQSIVLAILSLGLICNFILMFYFSMHVFPKFKKNEIVARLMGVIKGIKIKNFIACIVICMVVISIRLSLTTNKYDMHEGDRAITSIAFTSINAPLISVWNHIKYFGPLLLFFYLYIKKYKNIVLDFGIGMYITYVIAFILMLAPESRYYINLLPIIILTSILILKDTKINNIVYYLAILLGLYFSKIYIVW